MRAGQTKIKRAAVLAAVALAPDLSLAAAPLDLWTPEVLQKIRDQATLNLLMVQGPGYTDLFYDSEVGDAKWADSEPPYGVHTGDTIRIHGYLAVPPGRGPYPALVIGHGHRGKGSARLAQALALLGYVALSIDGPSAGLSTGGPRDTEQAWLSVEEFENQPSPEVSYLYHWAYAGMRALTLLESLAARPYNPYKIDPTRLGVVGASMGGQFTYYINGIDDRVRAAVAIAVAGDWKNVMNYDGAWLYHGLYYYTRDGWRSGLDALNAVTGCDDPTFSTFLDYFDPIRYAPTQHAPLLTILGSNDQYFTIPAINTTFDRVASAGTTERFRKEILVVPNGEHGVLEGDESLGTVLILLETISRWLKFGFGEGRDPLQTPSIERTTAGNWMVFKVRTRPGATPITRAYLSLASQLDSTPKAPCDFVTVPLLRYGENFYGFVKSGHAVPCGEPLAPDNVLYFASVTDEAGYTVSSKLYYADGEMTFRSGLVPRIQHWPGDDLPVPPVPLCAADAARDRETRSQESAVAEPAPVPTAATFSAHSPSGR